MRKLLMSIVFGTFLVLGACGGDGGNGGGSEEPADSGGDKVDTSEAEAIFKENCASCHGDDLSGGTGPDLTDVGTRLSEDEIKTQIEEGGNGMPPNLVEGEELETMSAWLAEKK